MADVKHTPGPWLVHDKSTLHMNDRHIAEVGRHIKIVSHSAPEAMGPSQDLINAEFIVRACNAHDDLLAACEAARDVLREHMPTVAGRELTIIEAALRKARGGT